MNPRTKGWSVLSVVEILAHWFWRRLLRHFILCCYHLSFEKGMTFHLNRPLTAYSLYGYHRILCVKFGGTKLVQWLWRRKFYNVVEIFSRPHIKNVIYARSLVESDPWFLEKIKMWNVYRQTTCDQIAEVKLFLHQLLHTTNMPCVNYSWNRLRRVLKRYVTYFIVFISYADVILLSKAENFGSKEEGKKWECTYYYPQHHQILVDCRRFLYSVDRTRPCTPFGKGGGLGLHPRPQRLFASVCVYICYLIEKEIGGGFDQLCINHR